MPHRTTWLVASALLAVCFSGAAQAQGGAPEPRAAVARMLDAPPVPRVILSPDRTKLLMLEPEGLPPRAESNQAELWLAGTRINPRNTAPYDLATYTALIARPIGRGDPRRIVIPWKARVANAFWSPDGEKIAFSVVEESGISLWTADPWSGESRMLAGPSLNAALGNPCQWTPGSDGLLCLKVLPHRSPELEQQVTSQLVQIQMSGTERPIGVPGTYSQVSLSPDGRFLLVESRRGPFQPRWTAEPVPTRTELWDAAGTVLNVLAESEGAKRIASAVPAPAGPRAFHWRADAPASLVWIETPDAGAPPVKTPGGERMRQLDSPFSGTPLTLFDSPGRIGAVVWGRGDLAVVTDELEKGGQIRTWVIDPSKQGGAPKLLADRASDDRLADPGQFILGRGRAGRMVLQTSRDGRFAFLAGIGTSPEGDRPYLDRLELSTRTRVRLWRSEGASYEEVVAILDQEGNRLITVRESPVEPPNYFVRELKKAGPGRLTALTEFKNAMPELTGISRQLLAYRRPDGVMLSAILYLPPGYRATPSRLPLVLWANPREFRTVRTASQLAGSPYRFSRTADAPLFALVLNGYGVLHLAGLPVVSPAGTPTADGYREQLIAGATASVEKVQAMGVADTKRIGIGGDVGGGAVAAALLQHSELFRAGVAEVTPEADGAATTLLVKPSDANARPLLTLLPWVAGLRSRESLGRRLDEMTDWMDRYVKRAGTGRP